MLMQLIINMSMTAKPNSYDWKLLQNSRQGKWINSTRKTHKLNSFTRSKFKGSQMKIPNYNKE